MKRIDVFHLLELGDHLFHPLFEVAPEPRARDERAHVEGIDLRVPDRKGDVAPRDELREALGDGRLPDARVAHVYRVVLDPPAQHLDGPFDDLLSPDQRVELVRPRLRGELRGEGLDRLFPGGLLLLRPVLLLTVRLGPRLSPVRILGHAVRYVIQQAVARDALLLEEEGGKRLRLVEDRDQDIADIELVFLRRRGVPYRPLEDVLESRRLLRLLALHRGHVLN